MRLVLIGPPGCGKGTQAKLLCRRHRLAHIGTGDLLREAIRNLTPTGLRARPFVESGRLVPDEVVNDLIAERIESDRPECFVMDGYPRTLAQARTFDEVLRAQNLALRRVLLLNVPDEEIVRRLSGRWSCPKKGCMATYHTENNPPKEPGICDDCGTALVQREDDREETVRARLKIYHTNRVELIPHYRAQRLFSEVSGVGEIEEVYNSLLKVLQTPGGQPC